MKWRNNPPIPLPAACLAASALLFYRQPPLLPVRALSGGVVVLMCFTGHQLVFSFLFFTENLPRETQQDCFTELREEKMYFKKLLKATLTRWTDSLKTHVALWVEKKKKISQHSLSLNLCSN